MNHPSVENAQSVSASSEEQGLITLADAAQRLNVKRITVHVMTLDGRLRKVKRDRVARADVEALKAQRDARATDGTMTQAAAARLLNLSPVTVHVMTRDGRLTRDSRARVQRTEVEALKAQRDARATPARPKRFRRVRNPHKISTPQAAAYLGVSERRISQILNDGRLQRTLNDDGRLVLQIADLDRYRDAHPLERLAHT